MANALLKSYFPIAEAVAGLLHPHGEVVIHDLKTQKIAAMFNSYSKRKVGDESLLEEDYNFNNGPNVLGPYLKMNWNGRNIKSITAVIRDENGQAQGLMCINLDVSVFDQVKKMINGFLGEDQLKEQPASLFEDDWREKVNSFVNSYLRK